MKLMRQRFLELIYHLTKGQIRGFVLA